MMKQQDRDELAGLIADRYVSGRIRALVFDLVNDDWEMVLHDLERLYRALKTPPAEDSGQWTREVPEVAGASIYHEDDGTKVEEFCQGPDEVGRCPRAAAGRPVACAGKHLATRGWDVGIAEDAVICPLLTLGLVRRDLPPELQAPGFLSSGYRVERHRKRHRMVPAVSQGAEPSKDRR
jgi:hypothetical protein